MFSLADATYSSKIMLSGRSTEGMDGDAGTSCIIHMHMELRLKLKVKWKVRNLS